MKLFEDENLKDFFKPLTSANRKFHYDCTKILIGMTIKYQSELHEADACMKIAHYIHENSLEISDEDGYFYSAESRPYGKAMQELKYLRSKGWVDERRIARNGGNLANVTYNCMRLISSLEQIFNRNDSGTLSNLLVNIHGILRELTDSTWSPRKDRPYVMGVKPLYESVYKLKEEMASFRVNIRQIRASIITINKLEGFNNFYLNDPQNEKILEDYRYITKGGRFPQYVSDISVRLREFISDESMQDKVLKEYSQYEDEMTDISPRERLESIYKDIQSYFEYGYDNDVAIINQNLDEYIDLLHTRLHLITRSEHNLAADLDRLLISLSDMETEKCEQMLEEIFDGVLMYSDHSIMEMRSISNRLNSVRKKQDKIVPVVEDSLSDSEKSTLVDELMQKVDAKYSSAKSIEYLDRLTHNGNITRIQEENVKGIDDVLYLLSSFINSDSDASFPYNITLNGINIDNNAVNMSGMDIQRRNK